MGNLELKLKKERVMKKIFVFLLLSVLAVSCYEDYIFDNTFSGVYFPYQIDVRTFVVGEGMKIEVGVALAGVRENSMDRNISINMDNSLINAATLAQMQSASNAYIKDPVTSVATLMPLPSNYYTISSNNSIVIKKGQHMGSVVIRADSANFLADAGTIVATYALPFTITSADADSIIQPKKSLVVGLKYENMLFGKYWHGGSAVVNRPAMTDTVLTYYTAIPTPESKIWTLSTTAPDALYATGYLDQVTGKNEMMLTLSGTDITVSSVAGSTFTIAPDGTSTFNRSKLLQDRKIFLKYSYTNAGNGYTYHCTDTLTFRNRIRDGVNEWQDENPSHYTK